MRTTGDGRLLVGGNDDDIDIPARRDKRVEGKAKERASNKISWACFFVVTLRKAYRSKVKTTL